MLAWASRAPRRIGYRVAARSWMYTDRVARPRELRPRHSVQNQWDLLAPLGIELVSQGQFLLGPNWGHDVFIPMDHVIGGVDQCGKGCSGPNNSPTPARRRSSASRAWAAFW